MPNAGHTTNIIPWFADLLFFILNFFFVAIAANEKLFRASKD